MNAKDKITLLTGLIRDLQEQRVLEVVKERIENGDDPFEIMSEAQEGMKQVGGLYEQEKYFISGLMMAGEIFRQVMEIVEPVLVDQLHGKEAGSILIGTVQGDIHDIGKNLFITMLRCYGFTVTDLGVDVSVLSFMDKIQESKPDIIAFSGLISSAYETMKDFVSLIRNSDDQMICGIPIIIGGGMINGSVCEYVGANHWAGDAMSGVELCREILVG